MASITNDVIDVLVKTGLLESNDSGGVIPRLRKVTDASGNTVLEGAGRSYSLGMLGTNSDPAPLGEVLHAFSSVTGLTGTGTQTFAVDNTVTWRGQPTVKLDVAAGLTGGVNISTLSTRLRDKTLTLAVYVPDYTTVAKLQPFMSHTAGLGANYVQHPNYTPATAGQRNHNGWHLIDVTADMFTVVGTGVTADGTAIQTLRLDLQAVAGSAATVYIGAAYLNLRNRPRIFMTFDDGRRSVIRNAFPITQKYNIPCTAYIIPPLLGATGITNYFTEDDALRLHDANWCIGNHGYNLNQSTTADSYTEIGLSPYVAQAVACKDWLDVRGFRGGAHHAYVEGAYDGALVAAMAAAGMQTARTIAGNVTTGAQGEIHSLGRHRYLNLNGGLQISSAQTVANHITEVDRAIRDGRDLFITAHDIFTAAEGGNGATSGLNTDFDTLCAHLAGLRANGKCDLLPVDRF